MRLGDSQREVKIVKAVEQTWQSKERKCAAVEEVMLERSQTACLYLLRCVQSADSLGVKHTGNTSLLLKTDLEIVQGDYLAPMIHAAFIGWTDIHLLS